MEPITVMTMMDENGNEIKPKYEKGYVLLVYARMEADDGNGEYHEFSVVRGRDAVIDTIFTEYIAEYAYVDFFTSKVMSEDTPPKRAISFYTFIRMMLEQKKLSDRIINMLTRDFDFYDVDTFNEYMDTCWYDCMSDHGINDLNDLDKYYKDSIENRDLEVGAE